MRKTGLLIADHKEFGKDQLVSGTLWLDDYELWKEQQAERNERTLDKAKKYIDENGFSNIRLVTEYWKPVIVQGVYVSNKKVRETTRKFEFD